MYSNKIHRMQREDSRNHEGSITSAIHFMDFAYTKGTNTESIHQSYTSSSTKKGKQNTSMPLCKHTGNTYTCIGLQKASILLRSYFNSEIRNQNTIMNTFRNQLKILSGLLQKPTFSSVPCGAILSTNTTARFYLYVSY